MTEPTFEQKYIHWLRAMIGNMHCMHSTYKPDWVPSRIRILTDHSRVNDDLSLKRIVSEGDELECGCTLFGRVGVMLPEAETPCMLPEMLFEPIEFEKNRKKAITQSGGDH